MRISIGRENDSKLIDRLVLGIPPAERLDARMVELQRQGWNCKEIAEEYGLGFEMVAARILRAKRRRAEVTR